MTIKINQTHYEVLPTGEYPAVIDDIVLVDGKYGEQLRFHFALLGKYQGRILLGWTSTTFSPNSKLFSWYRAALGGDPLPMEKPFVSDEIIGNKVIVVVVQKQGENGLYNRIEEVKPYTSGSEDPDPMPPDPWDS